MKDAFLPLLERSVGSVLAFLHVCFPPIKIKERALKSFSRKYQLSSFCVMKNLNFTFQEEGEMLLFIYVFFTLLNEGQIWMLLPNGLSGGIMSGLLL